MNQKLVRFLKDKEDQDFAEYALILGYVDVVSVSDKTGKNTCTHLHYGIKHKTRGRQLSLAGFVPFFFFR